LERKHVTNQGNRYIQTQEGEKEHTLLKEKNLPLVRERLATETPKEPPLMPQSSSYSRKFD